MKKYFDKFNFFHGMFLQYHTIIANFVTILLPNILLRLKTNFHPFKKQVI